MKSQSAVVKTDGAMIYEKPDFDSSVIDYLSVGDTIKISIKTYGPFYKVKIDKNKYGYVSDVDVTPEISKNKAKDLDKEKKEKKEKNDKKVDNEIEKPLQPVFLTQYWGPYFGVLNYNRKFDNVKVSSQNMLIGMKISGPDTVIKGPTMMDLAIGFCPIAPSYFKDQFNADAATGWLLFLETSMLFPLTSFMNGLIFWGIGLEFVYSDYDLIFNRAQRVKSTDSQLGAHALLGMVYRIKKVGIRFEPRGYYDSLGPHVGGFISIQFAL